MDGDKNLCFLVYLTIYAELSDLFMLILFNHCLHSGKREEKEQVSFLNIFPKMMFS